MMTIDNWNTNSDNSTNECIIRERWECKQEYELLVQWQCQWDNNIYGARNESRIEDSVHQSYSASGNQKIGDAGGRSMVKFDSY